jgi:hypothetical protein
MKHLRRFNESINDDFREECDSYLSDLEDFEIITTTFDWYDTRQGMLRIQSKHKLTKKVGDQTYEPLRRFNIEDVEDDVVRMLNMSDFKLMEVITRESDMKNINRPQDHHWDNMSEIPKKLSMKSIELYFELKSS